MNSTASPPLAERFPGRAEVWKLRTRTLALPRRPLVMGIVNVTPDSFSDGGRFFAPRAAVDHALALAAEGADILDIGGESTRLGAAPVPADEELRRVVPVIAAVREKLAVPISVDTSKAAVAREALAAGAQIVNDVTALTGDPDMASLAAESGCGLCAMHMRGTPRTMQEHPTYGNVFEEVLAWLRARRDALAAAGIERQRVALDPGIGIGFGKTAQHNLILLAHARRFHELGCPVLVGPSRKAFIGEVLGDPQADRTAGTVGAVLALAGQGVQIVRVHDVLAIRQALALYEATGGLDF